MFEDNTVFVVGAGASKEFGMPVGWELLTQIRDNSLFEFDGGMAPSKGSRKIYDTVIGRHLKEEAKVEQIFRAFADIHRGVETAGSIDEFINRHMDDPTIAECGKLQIAYAIIEAERLSHLLPIDGNEQSGLNWQVNEQTWIAPFSRALFDGVRATRADDIGSNITIICFNYDRCIEHYLEHAIRRAYRDIDLQRARQIVRNINIIHPYGWIGDIGELPFGTSAKRADLYSVARNLITWSESVTDQEMVSSIRAAIREASNIIFLGFGFANQNLELLEADVPEDLPYFKNVYATGYGLTDDVQDKLKRKITRLYSTNSLRADYHNRIKIMYGTRCAEFFQKQLLNFVV